MHGIYILFDSFLPFSILITLQVQLKFHFQKIKGRWFITVLFLMAGVIHATDKQPSPQFRLLRDLLDPDIYDPRVLPVLKPTDTISTNMSSTLFQVLELVRETALDCNVIKRNVVHYTIKISVNIH